MMAAAMNGFMIMDGDRLCFGSRLFLFPPAPALTQCMSMHSNFFHKLFSSPSSLCQHMGMHVISCTGVAGCREEAGRIAKMMV